MCEIVRDKPRGYIVGLAIGEIYTKTKSVIKNSEGKILTENEYQEELCSVAQRVARIPAWQK